jgi:hypothetical protein
MNGPSFVSAQAERTPFAARTSHRNWASVVLSLKEYLMREELPRATLHEAIFDFCRSHPELVVFGAQAVNVYLPDDQVRMTADVDVFSPAPALTANALAQELNRQFFIGMRVREVRPSIGYYRVYQARAVHQGGHRHLVDVRAAPPGGLETLEREGVRYVTLGTLVAMKLAAHQRRARTPKGLIDRADLERLLWAHPELRTSRDVALALARIAPGDGRLVQAWEALLLQSLQPDDPEGEY